MLVHTVTTVALRCPDCGKQGLYTLDRFSFCREKTQEILCSCGAVLAVVTSQQHRSFWLEVNCAVCDGTHIFRFAPRELWGRTVSHLFCQETELEIGHIGPREQVKDCLPSPEEAMEALVTEMGGADYFRNAEIMLAALTYVHTLAEEGRLTCACGQDRIELEIHPDRIELHCRHCHRAYVVQAGDEEELVKLASLERIELSQRAGSKGKGRARRRDNKC